jgi:hypothetical protein
MLLVDWLLLNTVDCVGLDPDAESSRSNATIETVTPELVNASRVALVGADGAVLVFAPNAEISMSAVPDRVSVGAVDVVEAVALRLIDAVSIGVVVSTPLYCRIAIETESSAAPSLIVNVYEPGSEPPTTFHRIAEKPGAPLVVSDAECSVQPDAVTDVGVDEEFRT